MLFIRTFSLGLILASSLLLQAQPVPPVAKRVPHQEVRHGATITDNYFWLREKSNPEVSQYLEAENAYTEAMTQSLKPMQDTLYKEMLGRIKQTDLGVPVHRGDNLYYTRTEEGKQYPIYCRKHGTDAREEILLDPNELGAGKKFVSIGHIAYSDDQNLMAYTTDFVGFRQYTLNVKDLRSGKVFEDTYERVNSVEFAADNKTLFFTTEDATTKRRDTLWRHTLGAEQFEKVYEEKDALYNISLKKTRDLKFLILDIDSTDTTEVRYLATDKSGEPFAVFRPRTKGVRYYADHRENLFYVRTNEDAKDFKLLTVAESLLATTPSKKWKVFVAPKEGDLIQGVDLFHDFAVVIVKSEALTQLRLFDYVKKRWFDITFPEPVYAVSPGDTPDYESTTYRFNYQSLVTPPSVYEYNTGVHMSLLLKRQEVLGGYDPAQYVTERQWATARDGVKVPLSIVYKKGLERDGKAPLFLYAYGSYGIGTAPAFSSSRLSLLDRGMVYVIAHIRGGDEMGEKWHEDGMLMNKKNTFFDFIDSAEYLIKEKWTSSDRLVIEGRSAGGLLMGAVVNLRPDLFRAVHAGVPFVDVMNTMMDPSLPETIEEYLEWGNPNEKEAYDYMKSYSPYDNLEKRAYPSILVTTSFHDSQVMYWEPAKYVARLRTLKTDSNPLLLKCKMDPAGHGGASGRYDRLKDEAFEYAWLLSQVAH
jgi:oligopeptidase B